MPWLYCGYTLALLTMAESMPGAGAGARDAASIHSPGVGVGCGEEVEEEEGEGEGEEEEEEEALLFQALIYQNGYIIRPVKGYLP